jgi:hypothetical protein
MVSSLYVGGLSLFAQQCVDHGVIRIGAMPPSTGSNGLDKRAAGEGHSDLR